MARYSRYDGKTHEQIVQALLGTITYPLPPSYQGGKWSPEVRTDFEHKNDLIVFKFAPPRYSSGEVPTNLRVKFRDQRSLRFKFATIHPGAPTRYLWKRVGTWNRNEKDDDK